MQDYGNPFDEEFLEGALFPKSDTSNQKEENDSKDTKYPSEKRQKTIDRYIEGADIALLMYAFGWLSVGILFTFTTNSTIQYVLEFYSDYDIMVVLFAIFHFNYSHKNHSDKEYKFLKFKETDRRLIMIGIGYVLVSVVFLVCFNFIILSSLQLVMGQVDFINVYDVNTHIVLSVFRIIGTEELVFRGFALIVTYVIARFVLVKLFQMSKEEKISILLAILVSGTYFGGVHIFRYYSIDPLSGNLSIGTVQSMIYLITLGLICAILTVKIGLWAAILLHTVNNLMALYGATFINFNIAFSPISIFVIIIFIIAILIVYKVLISIKQNMFYFPHFAFFAIFAFVVGYYTNSMFSREAFGIYFEHFHWILFAPAIYIIFKNRLKQGKLYSALIGICIGLFISDYLDILAITMEELSLTIVYLMIAAPTYYILNGIIKQKTDYKRGL